MSSEPIKSKRPDLTAPTPQNTPASAGMAPINSRAAAPGLGSVTEEDDRAAAANVLMQNPKLLSLMQNRLQGLVGQSSGYIENLPAHVRRRVAGLKGIQKEHTKLESQFQEEVLELEKKYFAKYTPLYQQRAAIIAGKNEPTDEQIKAGEKDEDDEEGNTAISLEPKEGEDNTPVNGVPEFWLSAMKNQPSLSEMITDRDEDALKHLSDLRMEYLDKPGFRLIFNFDENEYFANTSITKTYFYKEETGYGGDYIYDHAEGDKIDWKAGKDLTVTVQQKKQRNKNTKQTRIVKKTIPCDSFFNFFSPPTPPSDDDDEEEIDEDIEDRLELDYTLGEDIKEKLIPRAIDWFTGEALQFEALGEDFDEEFEDEDDEDEDDLSDDRDDDDDSDDEIEPHSASQKQDEAECKQS